MLKKATADGQIFIFGPQVSINEIVAEWISVNVGCDCECCLDADIPKFINGQGMVNGDTLVLWDCMGKGTTTIWAELGGKFSDKYLNCKLALFNVSGQFDIQIEKQALKRGVCGLFPSDCSPSKFIQGIKAILDGELWFSRRSLTEALLDLQGRVEDAPTLEKPLTSREKEILLCILAGATNEQIAGDLNISYNTVKTHIYNIYKKINVPNRLQASLWAAKYL
jgi:DNA-binding CsgD family transcriptional regulator